MRNQFGCRFWMDNDIRVATLGEARFGVCREVDNFIYVHVDRDVQMGAMVNGKVYGGADGVAGKLGHMCLDPDGPLCSCGNRGCLNMLASNRALVDFYRKLIDNEKAEITVEDIVEQARSGQTAAKYALEQAARWLGLALSNLANLMNPETIVIAGPISLAGELFLETILDMLANHTSPPTNNVRVEWSQLADQTVQLGALALALDNFFTLPEIERPIEILSAQ
jgi:predicted NBD/HSP70 family sugar kinase